MTKPNDDRDYVDIVIVLVFLALCIVFIFELKLGRDTTVIAGIMGQFSVPFLSVLKSRIKKN